MKKYPLSLYVSSVVIVFTILNLAVWFIYGGTELKSVMTFSLGFLLGMLAMFIAVHIYRWK